METPFEPLRFTHQKRHLHALIIEQQAWFCARDLGRLMGLYLENRLVRKLDPDQRCTLNLHYYGETQKMLMISESAAYALLVHHHHPANSQLRQWITYQVMPTLNAASSLARHNSPTPARLEWQGGEMNVMHWQNEPWIRLRDMPNLLPGREAFHTKAGVFWTSAKRLIRPGRSSTAL
jgi:prophage antirepressor-like protein